MVAIYYEKIQEVVMPRIEERKTVYVVMGNDYPECVYDDEAKAEKFIEEEKKKLEKKMGKKVGSFNQRIYWRIYAFDVRTS